MLLIDHQKEYLDRKNLSDEVLECLSVWSEVLKFCISSS